MDIKKVMDGSVNMEEFSRQLLDLDSEFRFKCRRCGKCCKHQDTILFTARDIFNIAKKHNMSTEDVVNQFAETYIGSASRIPVVHMVPRGPNKVCPFLTDGRCSIHDCKPTVCALYPLGRVVVNSEAVMNGITPDGQLTVKYMLNDTDCGSQKRVNTVREWLARFGIQEQDEFFLLWSRITIELGVAVRNLEDHHASNRVLDTVWSTIYTLLYLYYDTSDEFFPQFRKRAEALSAIRRELLEFEKEQ